ncbi:anaphase-promoting complex subunit 4-like [Camellia sinensis]|uniref:anaphase-promoting complex subunit 4-like n=1 Tax=Camellia sinensis TaxID=4442 RepID=UPI001036BC60|nr:anaphase-promoting complex subunit 4-like [Camellia sinensis]
MFLNRRSSSRTPSASFSGFLSLSFSIGSQDNSGNISTYEDCTSRFFPSAPRVPQMPGVVPGDTGFMDKSEDSFRELSSSSHQRLNILCSGDKDGSIYFSIFGIFPIGKVVS